MWSDDLPVIWICDDLSASAIPPISWQSHLHLHPATFTPNTPMHRFLCSRRQIDGTVSYSLPLEVLNPLSPYPAFIVPPLPAPTRLPGNCAVRPPAVTRPSQPPTTSFFVPDDVLLCSRLGFLATVKSNPPPPLSVPFPWLWPFFVLFSFVLSFLVPLVTVR